MKTTKRERVFDVYRRSGYIERRKTPESKSGGMLLPMGVYETEGEEAVTRERMMKSVGISDSDPIRRTELPAGTWHTPEVDKTHKGLTEAEQLRKDLWEQGMLPPCGIG